MDKISDLKTIILKTLDNNKALDIVSIDLTDKSSIADHMIIASGTSSRHIQALSEQVLQKLKLNGLKHCKIEGSERILDVGPKTIKNINEIIDTSKTVLWNGPAGYFENKECAIGTISIAKKIAYNTNNASLISIVGGGDTVALLNSLNVISSFDFVSTAGGAFLEYLEGKKLPGITALN